MTTGYYEELRKVHKLIRARSLGGGEDSEIKERMLTDAIHRVMVLCELARKEGLLALEEALEQVELDSQEGFLKHLIFLVLDGTAPENVRQIGLTRYYSSLVRGYEALCYLIYLEGTLSIQAGEHPRIVEEKLKVMLPESVYYSYCEIKEREFEKINKEKSENRIERLCNGKKLWSPTDKGYFVMKLADYVICDITDKELMRLLREIDNLKLSVAMKGLSGDARRHIFNCLSERLGMQIAEDIEFMGPVRAVDVLEATQYILTTLIYLIERGEIKDGYLYLTPFCEAFSVEIKEEQSKPQKVEELKELMKEYEEAVTHNIS